VKTCSTANAAGVRRGASVMAVRNALVVTRHFLRVRSTGLLAGVRHGIVESTMVSTIELDSFYTEEVTPAEYLRIFQHERDEIDSAQIVPPQLGQSGFGRILIIKKTPVFALVNDKSSRL